MWTNISPPDHPVGTMNWSDQHGQLEINAEGGQAGIAIGLAGQPAVLLGAVDGVLLPQAGESFAGDTRATINFPQAQTDFALRLTLDIIESTSERLVVECCVSVQTDLLDSHPKLDLDVFCDDIDSVVPTDPFGKDDVMGLGTAPISTAVSQHHAVSVLLGQHDHPFTTNLSTDTLLRLRLFGDFLEKGVIRRARPWMVFDRHGRSTPQSLETLWQQMGNSPLPLN